MRQNFRVSCFFLGGGRVGGRSVPATFGIAWPRLVLAPKSQIIVIANDDVDKFRKYPRHREPKSQHAIRRAPIAAVGKWRETLKEAFTRLTNALSPTSSREENHPSVADYLYRRWTESIVRRRVSAAGIIPRENVAVLTCATTRTWNANFTSYNCQYLRQM